ncbi:MAG TPA: DUF4124 domain-containing protein [Gammaproteobacteria bacterium]|nr:DUF4124 domain-containing protein [Gammaproteobacteria bacterium]
MPPIIHVAEMIVADTVNRCLCLLAGILMATTAAATEIYKWVDENGQTHYGEKPPHENAEKVEFHEVPEASQEVKQYNRDRNKLLQVMEEERLQKQQEKRIAAQEKQDLEEKCDRIEKRLASLQLRAHFYRENEDGERVYLTEEEVKEEIRRLQKIQHKDC